MYASRGKSCCKVNNKKQRFAGTLSSPCGELRIGGESEQWFWLTPKFLLDIDALGDHRLFFIDYSLSLRLTSTLPFSTARVRVTSELERPWANSARCLPWMPEYLKACW